MCAITLRLIEVKLYKIKFSATQVYFYDVSIEMPLHHLSGYESRFTKIPRTMKFKAEAFHRRPCVIIFVLQGLRLRSHTIFLLRIKGSGHYLYNTNTGRRLFLFIVTVHLHKCKALTNITFISNSHYKELRPLHCLAAWYTVPRLANKEDEANRGERLEMQCWEPRFFKSYSFSIS